MSTDSDSLWTIDELGERVGAALAGSGYAGVSNGRVRDVPDLRTIRFYATLGLVDRPAGHRGRAALYGPRHLRQLVAIKRLQARGLSLSEVQRRLIGAPDAVVSRIAQVPDDLPAAPERPPRESGRGAFWKAVPEHAPAPDEEVQTTPSGREAVASPPARPGAVPLQAVRLGDAATLLLSTLRPLTADDLRVVDLAAAPLLELLRLRGLIGLAETGPQDQTPPLHTEEDPR